VEAMKGGAMDFLEKPVDDEVLLASVHRAIERDRQRRRAEAGAHRLATRLGRLTSREREVMERLYDGKSIKKIACELGITFQTVAKHRTRALAKLEVQNEAELVRLLNQRRPPE